MTRSWDELVASVFDVVPAQYVLLILLAGAGLAGLLWYTFPAWVPRRLPRWRLRLPRWVTAVLRAPLHLVRWLAALPRRLAARFAALFRRRPRRPKKVREPAPAKPAIRKPAPERELVPVVSLADRLAAEGRYAEAIRERLRETVGALTRAGVVAPEPGETAAELAATAAARRPAVAPPLTGATALFSEVWYGNRPAGAAQDERMRSLSGEVRDRLRDGGPR
jgi:Asp-tRNA(Asn)/Glu-tRNA(Gln) amidotransferase A subunit family amidase